MPSDLARAKLCELVTTEGANLCAMPQMCEILLKQACPECPAETGTLVLALRRGVVRPLLEPAGVEDETALLNRLAEQFAKDSAPNAATARWAVEAWAAALHQHRYRPVDRPKSWEGQPLAQGGKPGPTPPGELGFFAPGMRHLTVVTVAGALGGVMPGIYTSIVARDWVPVVLLGPVGLLGGFIGGLMGWGRGGGEGDPILAATGQTTLGRLGCAALGAGIGAAIGVVGGASLGDVPGALVGSVMMAYGGAYAGWITGCMIS